MAWPPNMYDPAGDPDTYVDYKLVDTTDGSDGDKVEAATWNDILQSIDARLARLPASGQTDGDTLVWDSTTETWVTQGWNETKAFVLESPAAADDMPLIRVDRVVTLTKVAYLCIGGTNWVGQLQECDANGINGVDVHSSDVTATAGTTNVQTTFSNASIDAGDWIGLKTTSVSGSPTRLHVTFYYK